MHFKFSYTRKPQMHRLKSRWDDRCQRIFLNENLVSIIIDKNIGVYKEKVELILKYYSYKFSFKHGKYKNKVNWIYYFAHQFPKYLGNMWCQPGISKSAFKWWWL